MLSKQPLTKFLAMKKAAEAMGDHITDELAHDIAEFSHTGEGIDWRSGIPVKVAGVWENLTGDDKYVAYLIGRSVWQE